MPIRANFFSTISGTTLTAVVAAGNSPVTGDISTAGPIANGRDQAAAFPNGSKVCWYGIEGSGKTPALIASLSSTGPTLPTGYTDVSDFYFPILMLSGSQNFPTATAFINGLVDYNNASPKIGLGVVFFDDAINQCAALSGGTAVASSPTTQVDVSAFVPSEADYFTVEVLSGNGGSANVSYFGYNSGKKFLQTTGTVAAQDDTATCRVPNVSSQKVYYANSASGGVTYIHILGWET
jgi:hypothetical protein